MKFWVIILLLGYRFSFAQTSDMTIETIGGEKIIVAIDGIIINYFPQQTVRLSSKSGGMRNIDIEIFQNFNQTVSTRLKTAVYLEPNSETYYQIAQNIRQEYFLRLYQIVTKNNPNPPHETSYPTGLGSTTVGQNNSQFNNRYPEYQGAKGCQLPISESLMKEKLAEIESKSFESQKISLAKQFLNSNCVLVKDVISIMSIMGFESSKLEIAKYAYSQTYDQDNYWKVKEEFGFESSKPDLDKFIEKNKK